jgi:hypothetical protein
MPTEVEVKLSEEEVEAVYAVMRLGQTNALSKKPGFEEAMRKVTDARSRARGWPSDTDQKLASPEPEPPAYCQAGGLI